MIRRKSKLVYGVGINDADYNTQELIAKGGKKISKWVCPFYRKWYSMFVRCYSEKYQERQPTYKGCEVCNEWLSFSNFKAWMETQNWEGMHLDKDVLVEDNKVYSPTTCVFIPREINLFLKTKMSGDRSHLTGAWKHSQMDRYQAACRNPFTGERVYLGLFNDEFEAHLAWRAAKHNYACQLADSDYITDERVAEALRNRYK